jgi:hypothetical protein
MKKLGIILLVAVLLLIALTLAGTWRSDSLRKRAIALRAGCPKEEVRKVLGRPTEIFFPSTNFVVSLLGVHSETWAYGGWCNIPAAFRGESPVRFRLFGPDPDELAVVFDTSGRVARVNFPKTAQ